MRIAWDAAFRGEYRDKTDAVSHGGRRRATPIAWAAAVEATYLHGTRRSPWYDVGRTLPQRPAKEKGATRGRQAARFAAAEFAPTSAGVSPPRSYQSRGSADCRRRRRPGRGAERARPVARRSATDALARSLLEMWRTKSPNDAYAVLKQPDVRVTNQSDKDTHLRQDPQAQREDADGLREPTRKPTRAAPPATPLATDRQRNVAGAIAVVDRDGHRRLGLDRQSEPRRVGGVAHRVVRRRRRPRHRRPRRRRRDSVPAVPGCGLRM